MTWPTYQYEPNLAALPVPVLDHNNMRPHIDARAIHIGAADVWRDGEHLWRSYSADNSRHVDEWALEEFGADAPTAHDSGMWGLPGVVSIADFAIPTAGAMEPVGSVDDVVNLICTLFAIGQVPHLPDISAAPNKPMITGRMARTNRGYIVWKGCAGGVSVRLMVGRSTKVAAALGKLVEYTVKLEQREVRAGAEDPGDIVCRLKVFEAGENCPAHILVNEAKTLLGLTGWPMTRQVGKPLVWHLSKAPFELRIERLDG